MKVNFKSLTKNIQEEEVAGEVVPDKHVQKILEPNNQRERESIQCLSYTSRTIKHYCVAQCVFNVGFPLKFAAMDP